MSLIERPDTMQARLAEAEARIERLDQENARLWGAGALLAKGVPPFERRMHPALMRPVAYSRRSDAAKIGTQFNLELVG